MPVSHTNRRELLQKGVVFAAGCFAGAASDLQAAESNQQAELPKLKITGVTTYLLKHKLKIPFGVSVSVPLDQFRKTLLVKIETDAGLTGWGETAPVSGSRGTIDNQIAPRLIGKNPLEQRRLWRMMWGAQLRQCTGGRRTRHGNQRYSRQGFESVGRRTIWRKIA
ncbi:MAG: hypothetical protein ABIK07_00925 [Planctomycetota bacterium]